MDRPSLPRRRRRAAATARLVVALFLALAPSGPTRGAGPETVPQMEAARRIVQLTNDARWEHSMAGLQEDPSLDLAAETYARLMAEWDWFGHFGPDGSTMAARAEAAGYLDWAYLAENLAKGTGAAEPERVFSAWMGSPGHRDNLLSPHLQDIGVGCYVRAGEGLRFWCVQAFGTRGR